MGFWVEGGEILHRSEALRPLVKFTTGPGELGRDPAAPFSATADLRGIMPPLKYEPFLGGWGLSASQEKPEIPGFLGIAPGVEEGEPVVTDNPQSESDQGPATCHACVANLGSTDGLLHSSGRSSPALIASGVRACDMEQPLFRLTGPVFP